MPSTTRLLLVALALLTGPAAAFLRPHGHARAAPLKRVVRMAAADDHSTVTTRRSLLAAAAAAAAPAAALLANPAAGRADIIDDIRKNGAAPSGTSEDRLQEMLKTVVSTV